MIKKLDNSTCDFLLPTINADSPARKLNAGAQKFVINLVKKSWRLLRNVSPGLVADTFYSKLFLDHPELRRMFPKQMDDQYKKLIDMLSSMVARLDNHRCLTQDINDMAKRHEGYGVQPKHYAMVGAALLWTLEKGLGADWNEDTAEAWAACYGIIAGQMSKIEFSSNKLIAAD